MTDQYIEAVSINWDRIDRNSYLRDIEALRELQSIQFHKPVTFFVGENGTGKSTMLEAIAVAMGFNPEGGSKNYRFSTYDSHSELYDALRVAKGICKPGWGYFLRAESFYNVATMEMEYADSAHPSQRFHEKSHGESFLEIAQTQLKPHGLYFLDEPEAALSPQRQLALLVELDRCSKEESQFIIVTHSPILLGLPGADILSFDDGRVHQVEYEDTESYQVTEMFINHREHLLSKLLGSDTEAKLQM